MHQSWTHRFCMLLSTLVLVLAVACNRPPGQLADAAVTPDAGPDATVTPLRTLGFTGLFGQTPVENRFYDPNFSAIDGTGWNPIHATGMDICLVTQLHQRTPSSRTALSLEPPTGMTTGQVVGMAKGAPGPMEVSVWLGRDLGTDVSALRVSLYGLFGSTESAVDLEAASDVSPADIGGVSWVYHRAYLAEGPVGWTYLWIKNEHQLPLYISAPVLVRASAQARRSGAPTPAAHRALLPGERVAWQDWLRRLQDSFGGPPRPRAL